MIRLYHKDVYFKDYFKNDALKLVKTCKRLSNHTMNHISNQDKKHTYTMKNLADATVKILRGQCELFEIETDNGKVIKCVYRVNLENKALCIVYRENIIVTCYVNNINDTHKTLDKNKYVNY